MAGSVHADAYFDPVCRTLFLPVPRSREARAQRNDRFGGMQRINAAAGSVDLISPDLFRQEHFHVIRDGNGVPVDRKQLGMLDYGLQKLLRLAGQNSILVD